MKLGLEDPPSPPPEDDGRPDLRLVPKGPPVRFRVPEDPEVSWQIRAVAITLGVLISLGVVGGIFLFGSFVKHMYDTVEARRQAEAAKKRAAEKPDDGTIKVVIPTNQPKPALQAPAGDTAPGQARPQGGPGTQAAPPPDAPSPGAGDTPKSPPDRSPPPAH
ncbi:MAG TPA: hypothetical protein VNI57_09320 [Candidatus Saccharimonadales bacterium]|nr:hypothetical protein [Candidatus Saccharimonadales bacterium]